MSISFISGSYETSDGSPTQTHTQIQAHTLSLSLTHSIESNLKGIGTMDMSDSIKHSYSKQNYERVNYN